MIQAWKDFWQRYYSNRFVTYLSQYVNLDMIELASGQDIEKLLKSKKWHQQLLDKVDFLLPKFTYHQWVIILSQEHFYQKSSSNKTEDIRNNLYQFLKTHYKMLYQTFNMKVYEKYQWKEKKDIYCIQLIENAIQKEKSIDVVYSEYEDESRIAYNPVTKERMIIENIWLDENSMVITLVDHSNRSKHLWQKVQNFFTES